MEDMRLRVLVIFEGVLVDYMSKFSRKTEKRRSNLVEFGARRLSA